MALCRTCRNIIPCHCHTAPPIQIRPGVYQTTEPHPAHQQLPALGGTHMTLDELRAELAKLNHLPGNTPVVLATDAEGNGFSPLYTVDDALYEEHNPFSGTWYATDQMRAQNPENGWDEAPESTVPAVFLWPTS